MVFRSFQDGAGCPMVSQSAVASASGVADNHPAVMVAASLHPGAQHADRLVGQYRDEQVALGALGLPVVDGSQPRFRLEAAEHCLHLGQGHAGPPHSVGVQVGDAAAQAVHPGMRGHGAPTGS